jgi:DUF4097 and DUF4098 domain-containing protein YvlB
VQRGIVARDRCRSVAAGACAVLLAALFTCPPALAQDTAARPPDTDRTLPVARGARLTVDNYAGQVTIRAWSRDEVRVQARHMPRTRITMTSGPRGLAVSASGMRGPASAVEYEISIPAWMPVDVDCTYATIAVAGTESDVTAETVRGDIHITGGTVVSADAVDGDVLIEASTGRVAASSVNRGIRIVGASGDIAAETTNGPIVLSGITSETVDAGAVNGALLYDGTPSPRGRYRLSTHNGPIEVALPEGVGAVFTLRTYRGSLASDLALEGGGDPGRGRRVAYTLGGGGAEFDLESFGGRVHVRRSGGAAATDSRD